MPARIVEAVSAHAPDMVFVSQVFFNSGYALPDLDALVDAVAAPDRLVVIDGYHAFLALPVDLSHVADRAFYLAGGYKYAMAGEGACFMHCPPGFAPRPRNTGWYASFASLSGPQDRVGYATDGQRFMGATFDPSGLYRMRAALDWMAGARSRRGNDPRACDGACRTYSWPASRTSRSACSIPRISWCRRRKCRAAIS